VIHNPLLSICITSYNRVDELYRCLKSVDTVHIESIEIIVSEDHSPKRDAITQIVNKFILSTKYSVIYNSNVKNLGFDLNLGRLIDLSNGKFMLFVTDDDAFIGGGIDKIIDLLHHIDFGVAFTPYIDQKTGTVERKFNKSFVINSGFDSVKKHMFNSILLSGLILKKSKIINYHPKQFKDLIYSQVYLFCDLLLKSDGYYMNIPLVHCIGDGENGFGLNESGGHNKLLADRESPLSNLEYHKSLIKVIKIFDLENKTNLINVFSKEYSIRSYTGMSIARKSSISVLKKYWKAMEKLNIQIHPIAHIYYFMLLILGSRISSFILYIPKSLLLLARYFFK
jgi:glycosyltransferase involved in cell wall biosynthesis